MDEAMDEAALATAEEREEACELTALPRAAELTEAPMEEAREAAELIGLLADCAVAVAARPRRATILNCMMEGGSCWWNKELWT